MEWSGFAKLSLYVCPCSGVRNDGSFNILLLMFMPETCSSPTHRSVEERGPPWKGCYEKWYTKYMSLKRVVWNIWAGTAEKNGVEYPNPSGVDQALHRQFFSFYLSQTNLPKFRDLATASATGEWHCRLCWYDSVQLQVRGRRNKKNIHQQGNTYTLRFQPPLKQWVLI